MKLKFIRNAIYNGVIVHKEGDIAFVDNSKGMATRWLVRGVAIEVVDEVPVKEELPVVEEVLDLEPVEEKLDEVETSEAPKKRKTK